jgi:hypothetical protein
MRPWHLKAAILGVSSVALLPLTAVAGDWGCGRGGAGYYSPGAVYYASPTYSYAQPTVTIVPRVIVQPNYIIERTYVTRPTQYVRETAPCWAACEQGFRVVNQGQYPAFSSYEGYSDISEQGWTGENPGIYSSPSLTVRRSYHAAHRDYRHHYRRTRQVAAWTYHQRRQASSHRQYHRQW